MQDKSVDYTKIILFVLALAAVIAGGYFGFDAKQAIKDANEIVETVDGVTTESEAP